jgi:hypothetical protein
MITVGALNGLADALRDATGIPRTKSSRVIRPRRTPRIPTERSLADVPR